MKSRMSLLGLFLVVAMLLAACGGAASDGGSAPAADSEAGATMQAESASMDASSDEMTAESESMGAGSDEMMAESESVDAGSDEMMAEAESMDASSDEMMAEAESMNTGSDEMMAEAESMDAGAEVMMDLPAWFGAELTDVRSGETFSLADFQGKVVLVETMAIWCPTCLRQQQEVRALHQTLGKRDDLVTVVLDVDANEDAASLVTYAESHGFDWTYAVAPRDVAREIGQRYGDQFLNPPSTPMLIVDRHGEVHLLPFGRKTATDLQEALAPFLDRGM
jgi:cytochrome oxidase Cu insertion factor (SCO1/SenC/PrrC family)